MAARTPDRTTHKLGATTLPLAGWIADPFQPEQSRDQRLAAIRQLVEGYGLSAVELTMDLPLLFPQVFDEGFYQRVAGLQQEAGFVCTAHLPFLWVDLASMNEPLRQASVTSMRRAIELTRSLEVESYVLHLWGMATAQILKTLDTPQRQMILAALSSQAERSLAQVVEFISPGRLCIENMEMPSFEADLPLVEQYDCGICLDVGHLAWHDDEALAFLDRHDSRIREIHLHDAEIDNSTPAPRIRDHLALGQGSLDHHALLKRLEEGGFQGTIILENNTRADLEASLQQLGYGA